jgi:hypothetical protein
MKSVRLNAAIRESILLNMKKEFEKNALKNIEGVNNLTELRQLNTRKKLQAGEFLWTELYGHEPIAKVKLGLLNSGRRLKVSSFFEDENLFAEFQLSVKQRMPCTDSAVLIDIKMWNTHVKPTLEAAALATEIFDGSKSLGHEVKPILDSVNTSLQLVTLWPSCEKYLPASVADPEKGIQLPALTVSRLEEKIACQKK